MLRVVIVGCGVVGAAIAYEVSRLPGFVVTILEQTSPASGSTGAALGVAMAVISQRAKGRNWRLRRQSLERYQTLLPELEALTGQTIQRNTDGLLSLCLDPDSLVRWQSLQGIRQGQGYNLQLWPPPQLAERCPHLALDGVFGAIYSPQDFQVNPTHLTQALVLAAQRQGAQLLLGEEVVGFSGQPSPSCQQRCTTVHTRKRSLAADWVVLAAGMGCLTLTRPLQSPLAIAPVLGQGAKLHLDSPLGYAHFQPVVSCNDVHLVPLGQGDYWVGATVEASDGTAPLPPDPHQLDQVIAAAKDFCPGLEAARVSDRWFGYRPRPQNQAAPVIEPLAGYDNVWLATGHYRNGVLLAPATAQVICDQLTQYPV
ncbi:MAG: FAD-dependent oxidoreductase [Cyanobacteriota bacterium]|nr:FAD-dependent oxidoreductase [Cyanobacteriota bacterium]